MADRVGQQLGNYRLIHLLGRGTLGEVYLGEHLHLNSQVAVKVLHTHLATQDWEWLRTEGRTLARFVHPHIVRVLDFDVQNGVPFLVMEYAPNGTLRQRYPKGTLLPLAHIVSYTKQVADALQYAHERGVIHCDVKPVNLVLGRNQEVLLTDFSLSFLAKSLYSQPTQEAAGTIAYMAPEQIQGHPSPASDQYNLGILVYEWLSGEPPFSGSFAEVASQHLSVPPPALSTKVPTIPSAIEQIVMKALAKDPQQRFANVQTFAMALEEASRVEASGRTSFVPSSGHSAEGGQMSSSLLDLPRGTVTLLFTDIEGSTYLLQQLGDCYTLVLAECRQLLRAVFQQWSGHEIDTQGDAFFVAFARATDAVSATVDTQRILANHSWPEGVAVRIRMGLHTGEPSLTSEGYVGLDVHRAARIMSAAHGGQVLLSQTTCNLVEQDLPEDVFLRDLGEHRLKDLGRPRRLFQLVISDLPADFPPLKTLDTHPNNLPVQSTPFIGREQEVIAVQHLLSREDVRLLTLTGPGGTGKTRLGVQVAAEASDYFADGMFFVDLAPINDPALVVPTVAQTLSIREVGGQTLLERVKEELQQKQILLLLDNFEQVVVAAPQVADLLAACPQLKVVVTSREVLHVQAEHEFAVPPLALPDPKRLSDLAVISQYAAIALFIQRAQAVKSDFQLTNANARAVMEICARLDGLPLAIELAAARMKLLTPQALLTRLSQRFAVLTGGARDIPIRQQTLRNTIEWSYNLLDAREQRLFRRISVFVSGCTLEAIEAVCVALDDGSGSVLDGVASLIDKNMLYQTGQEGEAPRLMMLETLREYGLERLTMSGEVGMTQRSHAKHYLALAEEAELQFEGPQQVVWLARLEKEYDNLRAALQWFLQQGDAEQSQEMALQLGSALSAFSAIRGFWSETRAFLEQSLAGSEGVAAAMRAKALDLAAGVAFAQGDLARAEALAQESLALCREFGDTPGIARSFRRLAEVASSRGNVAMARLHSEEALTRWREVDDKEEIAALLASLVILDSKQGKYDRALTLLEENVLMYREQGNKVSLSRSLFPLAEILFDSQGDPTRVRLLVEEALSLCRELGDKDGIAYCFRLSGQLALSQGDVAVACSLAEKGLAMHRELEDRRGTAQSLSLLARTATLQGDHAAARALYEESLAIGKSMNAKELIAPCLEGLAGVVAAQGEPSWTARLWAAAEALREAMGVPIPPVYRAQYEQSIAAARSQLGEKLFASAWAEGRSMTLDQLLIAPAPTTMPASTSIAPASAPLARKPAPYPDGLTAREVEVLRLVADGLTDTQVAAQLVISPATVNTHLKAIYGKIGVSSRGAATRYAMERHLI